jgi:transcriptional regulator with XRE-family HTH domain
MDDGDIIAQVPPQAPTADLMTTTRMATRWARLRTDGAWRGGWPQVVSEDSRRELAHFLRTRRARVTPTDVGLPAGGRRRAPGLRREEVAVLAGLSPTWYTYLEQGRDIHPSAQVLDSLARVLGLTEDERRYLHRLAHGHVGRPRPLADEATAEQIVRQLVATAADSPYPVYAANIYGDLIAWNPAAKVCYTDFGKLPPQRRNMIHWLLVAPEARERLADWSRDARDIVARWRAMTASLDDDPRLHVMVGELRERSPEFGRWWDSHDVREHRSRLRRFRHPELGEQVMRLVVVRAPEFEPCIVAFHLPTQDLPAG